MNIGPAIEHIRYIVKTGGQELEEKKSEIIAVFASLLQAQKVSENIEQMTSFVEEYFGDSQQEKDFVMDCLNSLM